MSWTGTKPVLPSADYLAGSGSSSDQELIKVEINKLIGPDQKNRQVQFRDMVRTSNFLLLVQLSGPEFFNWFRLVLK